MNFKKEVEKLIDTFEEAQKNEVDLSQPILLSLDFTKSRNNLCIQTFENLINSVQKGVKNLELEQPEFSQLKNVILSLQRKDFGKLEVSIGLIKSYIQTLDFEDEKHLLISSSIPTDIFSDVEADVNEMERCFKSGCYRSVAILCGRMLEVLLHRKYYEKTEVDLLEKSPGIGLGNLIAKMREKGVDLDPAITQQIHLINQVRIFSVHKKQQPFYPSRAQAQAMMLYTQDIMEKLF